MPSFELNQRVSVKSQPQIRGRIIYVHTLSRGKQIYDVTLDDGTNQSFPENELVIEVISDDPWKLFSINEFATYRVFGIATTLFKVENTANNTISTLKASRTLFRPYQFKPLIKFLNSDIRRILIADEVGLGKTIEAGHILIEMAGRNLMKNALVICPKSLQHKWKTELSEKFHFEFKIYEHVKDLSSDIERDINLGQKSLMGIINYEKLRPRENEGGEEANPIISLLNERGYTLDLLICDEAHKIRNHTTKQHKGIRLILEKNAVACVFLTATPIMTSVENLYQLISLLDSKRYFNYELFYNAIRVNKPFIKALNSLHKQIALESIADDLESSVVIEQFTIGEESYDYQSSIQERFHADQLYQKSINMMRSGDHSNVNKAKIQEYLTELNSLNHIYTRTRKKQVLTEDEIITREPKHFEIDLTEEEQTLYKNVNNQYEDGNLGLIQIKRQIASSIGAYITPDNDLNNGYYNRTVSDSKFDFFFSKIVSKVVVENNKKIIVFAFFKKTLKYLKIRLEEKGIGCQIIHGDIEDRTKRIDEFRMNTNSKVLLSSEVGSEGIDLQFCDVVVNYDLPWNPMVVEQRIGRIDRFGQESKKIFIFSFALKNTIEQRIYERLLSRINVFKESLGDLEDILGEDENLYKDIQKLELELYSTNLTEKQQIDRIDAVALAIEKQKLDLQNIENDLTDAIVNDLYFKDEINKIVSNNRYITEEELISYTESIFYNQLKTCLFKKRDQNEFVIEIPNNNKRILFQFILDNMDRSNTEIEKLYNKFKTKYYDELKITLTYNQEYSFRNPTVEFINAYHPFINSITNFYKKSSVHIKKAHLLGLSKHFISKEYPIENGHYVMVFYNIIIDKQEFDKRNNYQYVHACLVDINGEEPKVLPQEISDYILGLAPIYANEPRQTYDFNDEFVNLIRSPVIHEILEQQSIIEDDEKIKLNSSKYRREELERKYYDNQIDRLEKLIESEKYEEKIKRIWESKLAETIDKRDERLKSILDSKVNVSHRIISVNHLEIFD